MFNDGLNSSALQLCDLQQEVDTLRNRLGLSTCAADGDPPPILDVSTLVKVIFFRQTFVRRYGGAGICSLSN